MGYEEFLDFMPETIQITALLSTSASGQPTYDDTHPVEYACRIQMGNHLVVTQDGREVTARGTIYVGTLVAPPLTSKLTLPVGFTVRNPPLLDSSVVDDENGPHHVQLEIG
jgi:hypothetical protein